MRHELSQIDNEHTYFNSMKEVANGLGSFDNTKCFYSI